MEYITTAGWGMYLSLSIRAYAAVKEWNGGVIDTNPFEV
jgi:hypothetical protein